MKKLFTLLAIAYFAMMWAPVQAQERCATMDVLEQQLADDPTLQDRMDALERKVQDWIAQQDRSARGGFEVYTIPVVVHVVWVDSAENIPDSQVFSQMDVLNEDFRRMNADTSETREVFKGVASDVGIEFCLATVDPDGNPTTGIVRTQGNPGFLGAFDPFTNNVKSTASGGVDPWPVDEYLNIWVCNIISVPGLFELLGYAQFPQTMDDPAMPQDVNTDGVVIDVSVFGREGDLLPGLDDGRTTTHEVGHWLGLRHIWGDGDCAADDLVSDTPLADAASGPDGSCPENLNSCVDTGAVDFPNMIENYMDYTNCQNMFSAEQALRMRGFLLNDPMRFSLTQSNKCSANVSIEDELNDQLLNSMSLYPNPSSGIFEVDFDRTGVRETVIRIVDTRGAVITEVKDNGQGSYRFDLTDKPAGIYFVKVQTDQATAVKKVVRH